MSLQYRASGTYRDAKAVGRNVGGTWMTAKEVWRRGASGWVRVWQAFTAVASRNPIYASATVIEDDEVITRPVTASGSTTITATPSDGVTYTWTHTGTAQWSFSGATATVTYSSRLPGSRTGTLQCVVTRGDASVTLTIPYTLTIESL